MMSLINTNYDYLSTMGIGEEDPLVGVIVSVYYLGTAVGAVLASAMGDQYGRRPSIFACLATASVGNLIMFVSGLGGWKGTPAMAVMFVGRIVMGLGIGGLDSVVPVYSSELSEDDARGRALAQEFQANILGLNIAFAVNLVCTHALGKYNEVSTLFGHRGRQLIQVLIVGLAHPNYRYANLPTHPYGTHRPPPRVPAFLHLQRP